MSCPQCADDCLDCRSRRVSVDRDTLHAVITDNVNRRHGEGPSPMHQDQMGIVEGLRAAFADIDPVRQYGLLLQLLNISKSPGFGSESFSAALKYLREGQAHGIPPSQWGLKALMREEVKE